LHDTHDGKVAPDYRGPLDRFTRAFQLLVSNGNVDRWLRVAEAAGKDAMTRQYSAHFVDDGDNVFTVAVFELETDEQAIAHAHRIDVPNIATGFDVWHEDRPVYRHRQQSRSAAHHSTHRTNTIRSSGGRVGQ
jgi:hypothetical protein